MARVNPARRAISNAKHHFCCHPRVGGGPGIFMYCSGADMPAKSYWIYMLASQKNGTLYIGVTSDLIRRVYEHRNHLLEGFTKEYDVSRLVYYEEYDDIGLALTREKQLKKWNRAWKLKLIESNNPSWKDLYEDLYY